MVIFFAFFSVHAAKPTISISASPATIFKGGSSTLTWSSTGATSAYINQGTGSVPLNGSLSVSPARTTTYTVTVRNSSGYRRASAKVTVKPALPSVTFGASPDSVSQGQSATLSWTTGNATTVSINQGIGTVALNGSRSVSPSATTIYTLTAAGSGGTVTAAATVNVNAGPPEITFNSSPTTIQVGQCSILNWTTVSATSVTIEPGIGAVDPNGSATVFPAQTTIYTLIAVGPGGTASSQVEVQVQSLAPTVALTVNPASIQSGETATLNWTSSNVDSALLDNGIGAVELNGSLQVAPTATTTYAISVTGPGGTKTAAVTLTVFSGTKYYAYIPDATDKKLRVVDIDTGLLYQTIDVIGTGTSLQGIAAESSGVFTYVADTGTTRIIKIDPLTMAKVGELPLTGNFQGSPRHLSLARNGCYLYATSSIPMWNPDLGKYVGSICTIKTSGNAMSAVRGVNVELPSRISLEGLAVSLDDTRLFVADPDSSRILVLDAAKLQQGAANMVPIGDELIATIPLASPPLDVVFSPAGQTLYAFADSTLFEIDAQNLMVNRSLVVPGGSRFMKTHPDGSKVYIATGNSLSIVETLGLTKTATVSITGLYSCSGLDVHPDGSRLCLVDKTNDRLITVSTNDHQVLFTTSMGTDPAASGKFMGHLPLTLSGTVTQDERGLSGVTMTLDGEGVLRTMQTAAAGEFLFGLKPGDYQLTPTMSNLAFTPESTNLHVTKSQTGLDFAVSGVIPPPTVTLSSSSTWVKQSESFTLTWESTGADYVTLEMVTSDHLPPSGSRTFTLKSTSTIWAVAYNRGGSASASVKVYVSSSDPPTASIIANPTSILQGGSSTLSWTSAYASTITIDNGIGMVAASGSKVVSPAITTMYTMTVTHYSGYKVTASTTIIVSEFDTSAKLTGTVTDSVASQPLNEVMVNALDASGVPQTALTDVDGKYAIANLRAGNVTASFAKTGYDPYQQTIIIPSSKTFDLTTQLHQIQIGATLKGVVKDGQSNQPIAGATVTVTYFGSSQTSISAAEGSYILTNIPLGVSATITANYSGYQSKTIQQTFSQAKIYAWDFVLYDVSAVAMITGKLTNAKTLLPEAGVKVTHLETNTSATTTNDGIFNFDNILFGEQSFSFEKTEVINEIITYSVDHTPFSIELIKPNQQRTQIRAGTEFGGSITDLLAGIPLVGAVIKVPGLNIKANTDQNGHYSFAGLPEGKYPMLIMAVDHAALEIMATIAIGESNTADFPLYPLTRGLIKGTITDFARGEPIPYASIGIDGNALLSATSEGDGTYKFVGIPPGIYKLKISQAEYFENSIENVEIQDMIPTTVNMQLKRRPQTGGLEGKILDIATNNPVSGALVTVLKTSITSTTDVNGSYQLKNVPAGLNNITISATGYPSSLRTRSVNADESLSSPTISSSDIYIDPSNASADEKVTKLITMNEGGDIATIDNRFSLHIFPGTLSADATISVSDVLDGPSIQIGSELPMDPNSGLSGIKASSIMTQIEIAPVVQTDPIPMINGLVVISARYSQNDVDEFQLDESTAFPYSWDESYFTALSPRPYEIVVDKVNNIAYAAMDISTTISGSSSQFSQHTLLKSDPVHSGSVLAIPWAVKKFALGKVLKASISPPKPNIKIFDKNELDCVTNSSSDQKPNPNALPLIFIHGFDPKSTFVNLVTNPNNEERYKTMLEDLVAATNGVYRPIFISYNTEAKISSIGMSLAEKFYGDYLNKNNNIKGLPTDPNDPDSGTFPYVDTFGFSMGGLVSRVFAYGNPISRVHNMIMIGTPNHGTFFCLRYLKDYIKLINVGASDQIDYDDSTPEGLLQNPFLFGLNLPITAPFITPQGDISLFAGTDKSAWMGFFNAFMENDEDHDSFVPLRSVFCRPTKATTESGLSLLQVRKNTNPKEYTPIKFEIKKDFNHDNLGSKLKQKQIAAFIAEISRGLSDWVVEKEFNEYSSDNEFLPPTENNMGYAKYKVKVEYNVWDGSGGRPAREIDRVVLVVYHKDGNGDWHISQPNGGENGADTEGNVIDSKVLSINGNSNRLSTFDKILNATINFDPNPKKDASGYDPEKDIVEVVPLVIALKPGKMTVPLDPTKVNFRVPKANE